MFHFPYAQQLLKYSNAFETSRLNYFVFLPGLPNLTASPLPHSPLHVSHIISRSTNSPVLADWHCFPKTSMWNQALPIHISESFSYLNISFLLYLLILLFAILCIYIFVLYLWPYSIVSNAVGPEVLSSDNPFVTRPTMICAKNNYFVSFSLNKTYLLSFPLICYSPFF